MKDVYSYIEFEFESLARFEHLKKMFSKLKEIKAQYDRDLDAADEQNSFIYRDPVDDYQWKNYLDEGAIAYFADTFDFNSEEGKIYWQLWELTDPAIRLGHPFFKTPGNWHLESTIDAIFNSCYSLIDLKREKENQGCLYYKPTAYPFGSSASLIQLIQSFGNKVTYDSRHKYNKPAIQSEWDYGLAKQLVKRGIGFNPKFLSK